MIRINQLKLNIKHSEADLKEKILKTLCISEDSLLSYEIKKQSLDARRKPELYYVYAVDVKVDVYKRQIMYMAERLQPICWQPTTNPPDLKSEDFLESR